MSEQTQASAGEGGQENTAGEQQAPAREYVNLSEITDIEKLRDIQGNPDRYTTDPNETTSGGEGEGDGRKPNTEGEGGGGGEGQENSSGETDDGGGDKDHGDEVPKGRSRVKIKISHLPEAQREVVTLVSKGKTLPEAQSEVVTKLVRDGMSLSEAEEAVYGGPGRRRAVDGTDEPTDKKGDEPDKQKGEDPIEAQRKKIEDIKSKLKLAREEYRVDEIEDLRDELDDARWELRMLEEEYKQSNLTKAQKAAQEFENAVTKSVARSVELFPDAEKEGTELYEAIQDRVEELREENPAFFQNPDWPEILTAVEAAKLGIPSAKHKAGARLAQGDKRNAVPPKTQARQITPASGTSGGTNGNSSTVEGDIQAEYEAAQGDPEKLQAFIRKYGTRDTGVLPLADAFSR